MNREIKFRGQRIDNNEWVYGYYVKDPKGQHRIYWQPFEEASSNTYHFVKPETIGQFTGILDKANTEVYEGDFVSTDLQRPHNKVIYKNGAFMFECFDDYLYHDIFYPTHELQQAVYKYGQVIGNIINNPELDAVPS